MAVFDPFGQNGPTQTPTPKTEKNEISTVRYIDTSALAVVLAVMV